MRKRIIILLVSLILSLPFWWGINILARSVENFYFWQEIAGKPEILAAKADQQFFNKRIKELERRRRLVKNFRDLKINARAAIAAEINSKGNEEILFERKYKKPLPIASITKLMTALVIFDLKETYNPSQLITISKEAVGQEGDSKWGGLKVGEKLSVKNLLHMALIESNNDAAFALTEPIGEKGFVDLMNMEARKIGLTNTRFFNPTGLEPDEPNGSINYSTTGDLVKLAQYILKNYPRIFEITTNQSYAILKPNGAIHHFIPESTNKLLGKVPGIIGGKTGWSPKALGCLLLILKNSKGNGYFITVVLGSNDRFGDMEKIIKALEIKN